MNARDPLLDALRRARRARAHGAWSQPPDAVVERAVDVTSERRPPRARRRRAVRWPAADVRGVDHAAVADDARIVAASCPGGEISVLVHPPHRSAFWTFEVRAWLRADASAASAVVELVHEDHVLHRVDLADGRTVRFEEVAPGGWTLELHLPSGHTVVLDDPFVRE